MTCSKLAVLNKAIHGTFFKSQKSKNRLKRHRLLFTWEKQWQIERSMALFKVSKNEKKGIGKLQIHIHLWLRKVS